MAIDARLAIFMRLAATLGAGAMLLAGVGGSEASAGKVSSGIRAASGGTAKAPNKIVRDHRAKLVERDHRTKEKHEGRPHR